MFANSLVIRLGISVVLAVNQMKQANNADLGIRTPQREHNPVLVHRVVQLLFLIQLLLHVLCIGTFGFCMLLTESLIILSVL